MGIPSQFPLRNIDVVRKSILLVAYITITLGFARAQQLTATGSIHGFVFESKDAIVGASVTIEGEAMGAITDSVGKFELLNVPPGKQIIHVNLVGYQIFSKEIMIEQGNNIDIGRITIAANSKNLNEVTIQGKLKDGSENQAISMTKTAPQLLTVLSSETIKKLPDKNAADALKRLAGVVIQNVKGEGGYVSLRGTPNDWTSTLINGDRLPVADEENTSRSFEFEVLPSDLIDRIDVTRTVTPDLEGDNIGGSINFILKEPVDKRTFLVNVAGGFDGMSQKSMGNINLLWGDISKNGRFKYVLNATAREREYAVDAFTLIYGNNFNHAINQYALKDYKGSRINFGFNGGFDYQITDKFKLSFKAMTGIMIDNKSQNKLAFTYASGDGMTIQPQFIHGILNRQLFGGELSAEIKPTERLTLDIKYSGCYNRFYYGNYPNSKGDPRNGYFNVTFNNVVANFSYYDVDPILQNGQRYNPNVAPDPNNPVWNYYTKLLAIDNPYNPNNPNNPYSPKSPNYNATNGTDPYINPNNPQYNQPGNPLNPYFAMPGGNPNYVHGDSYKSIIPLYNQPLALNTVSFKQAYTETNHTYETDPVVGAIDGKYEVSSKVILKFGVKTRYKEGDRSLGYHTWVQNFNNGSNTQFYYLSLFQTQPNRWHNFLSELGSNYNNITMPNMTQAQLANFISDMGNSSKFPGAAPMTQIWMDEYNPDYFQWVGSTYDYKEYQNAGYLMVDATIGKVNLTGGLRLEHSYLYEHALNLDNNPAHQLLGVDPNDGLTYAYQPTFNTYTHLNYLAILPSLNMTWKISDNMNLRAATSRSFHRQNFQEVKPGAALIKYSDFLYIQGNPDLKPTYAYNFDLSYQYFWGNSGLVTLSTYGKYIVNHIFVVSTGSYDPLTYFIEKSYRNANNSWVWGAEFEIKKKFDFLPGFAKGFGVSANITYSISRMHVPGRPGSQAMSEQSPLLYNVSLYYEKYGFKAAVGLNYNSPFLLELNLATLPSNPNSLLHSNSDFDTFMGEQYSMDAQLSYEFKKHFSVYVEASNLLDWAYKEYIGNPERPLRVEYYNRRGQIGFTYKL